MTPSREDIDALIAGALAEYDEAVAAEWARIRIEPAPWRCGAWGERGHPFWAVAVDAGRVLWFNEIREGFNWSAYTTPGTIDEYGADRTPFRAILHGIERAQSEAAWARLVESGVPADAYGAGAIARRQTTYWDLRAASGAAHRVHFRGKAEQRFAGADYPGVEIATSHPLLVQHVESWRALYFVDAPLDAQAAAEQLDRAIRDESAGWRSLADYTGGVDTVARLLRAGYGKLADAPASVCGTVARVLEAAGVRVSILGDSRGALGARSARGDGAYRALLLGRSYVIARAFAFAAPSSTA